VEGGGWGEEIAHQIGEGENSYEPVRGKPRKVRGVHRPKRTNRVW